MCTAITYKTKDFYFGRNLDLDISYGEGIVITKRDYTFSFNHVEDIPRHEAIIGMGIIKNGYPLYFDAVNESGLGMAGLFFPLSYKATKPIRGKENIASFELIPYILGKVTTVKEAKKLLKNISVTEESFSPDLPPSPLHWIIADKACSIVVESTKEGLMVYDNPVGVLTNEPEFPFHLFNLNNYIKVSPYEPKNDFIKKLAIPIYCKGMGGLGLPGDYSSTSRFIKAAFMKSNVKSGNSEEESVSAFMHMLDSVAFIKGSVTSDSGANEITIYSSCINATKGIYYYKTYSNNRINMVDLHREELDSQELVFYPLETEEDFHLVN